MINVNLNGLIEKGQFGMSRQNLTIRREALKLGLFVDTYSTDKRVSNYRFFYQPMTYSQSEGIYTAKGSREALAFLTGYAACLDNIPTQPKRADGNVVKTYSPWSIYP